MGAKKTFRNQPDRIWLTHMIWLLVYGLTSTVTMFTGSMKKGCKHMTEEKLHKGAEQITFFILF